MIFSGSKENSWRVARGQAYIRSTILATGHLVVEAVGMECEVRQYEEFTNDGTKVKLVLH